MVEKDSIPIVVQHTFGAPIDEVWQAIVDPDRMRRWYFETIPDFVAETGFETQFTVRVDDRDYVHLWKVTEVTPGRKITYNWRYRGYPGDSFVTWELSESPGGTKLTLTHDGIETFPQDNPIFSREAGHAGWSYFVTRSLRAFLKGGKVMGSTAANDVIRVGPIEVRFRLQAGQTGGKLTMFEFLVPAQARVPVPHSHETFDETVYGLAGVATWELDGRQVRVRPGDVLFIPRGHVHHFANLEPQDARQLSVITPGLLGPDYFREIAEVVNVGGPPNVERIMEVMRRHGLRPAPSAP